MPYRFTIHRLCLFAGLIFTPYAAHASFTVINNGLQSISASSTTAAPPVMMAPIIDPGDIAQKEQNQAPEFVHWKMAYGFGNKIPLSFACKQIVPPAVKVTYGPGADPGTLVTWKGGRGWNQVLLAAVKPLGLKLVMTHMAVEIRN